MRDVWNLIGWLEEALQELLPSKAAVGNGAGAPAEAVVEERQPGDR
jgi:hypothetical protein